jgi:hypothetical protein
MNKFLYQLKRFLKNKNTVTIILTLLAILILYAGYTWRVNVATSPIRVPVAKVIIDQRTLITSDMIEYIDVPNAVVSKNVIRSANAIIGRYTNYNVVIPQGSPFYRYEDVAAKDQVIVTVLPDDAAFAGLKEGQIPYNFKVNIGSTYGNSIFPDSVVDIYMKANDGSGRIMVGKFISDVRILGVKDELGNDVFESTFEVKVPNTIIFGLDKDLHLLMRKASYLSRSGVELFAVPRTGNFTSEEKDSLVPKAATSYLRDYVIANTVTIDEETLDFDEEIVE